MNEKAKIEKKSEKELEKEKYLFSEYNEKGKIDFIYTNVNSGIFCVKKQ